jgi:hypothetical protein
VANFARMARALRTLSEPDLEIALLRKSVGTLAAGRHACADCGRTPLTGERMFRYKRHGSVCALCRPLHGGEPDAVEVVRHAERGHTVRRIVPHAA